ncbi:MAG TPA: glycosyltransferase family 2 protein [bacterium]
MKKKEGPNHKPVRKVAVVILNWNRKDMVLDCLDHIRRLNYPVHSIIVVDNASTDGSVQAIRQAFPEAVLVVNDKNYGAPQGKNIGLRKALETDAEYVYMVDNDITVDPDSLSRLVETAEGDPVVGMVGTKMYDAGKPGVLLSAGGVLTFTENVGSGRGRQEKDVGQYDSIEEVDYLWGGALLAKRSVLEKTGLFDTGYLGYWFEDTDLSMRVKRAGYKILYHPRAVVWHKPHAASEQFSYRKKYNATRNAVRFMKKYATFGQWIKYLFFVIGGIPYAFFRDLIFRRSGMGAVGKAHGLIAGLMQKLNREEEWGRY